jgi:hypothetical protein
MGKTRLIGCIPSGNVWNSAKRMVMRRCIIEAYRDMAIDARAWTAHLVTLFAKDSCLLTPKFRIGM